MAVRTVVVLAGFFFILAVGRPVAAQEPTGEAIPTPPPSSAAAPASSRTQQAAQPGATYTPLDAGRDAHARGEAQRGWALNRQLQVGNDVKVYNSWAGPAAGTTRVEVHAPASPWLGSRAFRVPSPYSYPSAVMPPPLFAPWPAMPGGIWGSPYYPWAMQPIGHEKTWTSPNGYIYAPRYAQPLPQAAPAGPQPVPADPATRPEGPRAGSPREF